VRPSSRLATCVLCGGGRRVCQRLRQAWCHTPYAVGASASGRLVLPALAHRRDRRRSTAAGACRSGLAPRAPDATVLILLTGLASSTSCSAADSSTSTEHPDELAASLAQVRCAPTRPRPRPRPRPRTPTPTPHLGPDPDTDADADGRQTSVAVLFAELLKLASRLPTLLVAVEGLWWRACGGGLHHARRCARALPRLIPKPKPKPNPKPKPKPKPKPNP